MNTIRRIALSLACLALPSVATASDPLLFQYGGRGAGQAGALTARADQPLAVRYNPAAIVRLDGLQIQAGLDFTAPRDDYESATGEHAADHIITLQPSFYVTWKLPEDRQPFAFGLGFDNRSWYLTDWDTALFPGRFVTRRQELVLYDLHPVVAYAIDEKWSVGGGLHYLFGTLGEGDNMLFEVAGVSSVFDVEVERLAEADVDGLSFDIALHYATTTWGWGLVADSGSDVDGGGDVEHTVRPVPQDPLVEAFAADFPRQGTTQQSFDLPWELRTGLWISPRDRLRLELDVAYSAWSSVDSTAVTYLPNLFTDGTENTVARPRDWDDVVSVRFGADYELGVDWLVSGGLAWEPSPVPDATVEPGFPRGDALHYALGASYLVGDVSFDVGYSFVDYDDRAASGQEPESPEVVSTYSARDQRFGFSISWRR